MRYYPVNLDVTNKHCLVVGGGRVGERKVKSLLGCGAKVLVIAQDVSKHLEALASEGLIEVRLGHYQSSDLKGKFLVIGATDDEDTNQRISQDAESLGVLCNIADRPQACSFVVPATVRQGDLLIAVSTSNKSPAVATWIRQGLEREFGPEYAALLNLMGAVRKRLKAEAKRPEAHKELFERLLNKGLLDMIRQDRTSEVDHLLMSVLGKGYTWKGLMSA